MSIQSEITRISGNVSDALDAIEAKGVTIPSGSNSDDLATLISQITGGGGGIVVTETQDSHGGTIVEITGETVTLQSKSNISPSESSQTIQPDEGYTGLSSVQINAIPSNYVGTGVTQRTSSDLEKSGATVTAPAGYYASSASASVSSGSATTPATTVTANPTISVNSSTGVITATASATKSVTPTVSAGYVSSGTAGTITVSGSNTSNLTTQAAQTIHPSTTDQTIAAGKYLTGTQTISAVTHNITADVIKSGTVVKIGDSSDDDCVANIVGTYAGGSSKNVQTNQTTSRTSSSTLTSVNSLTCSTAGKYDVYWTCMRSSTGGTWSSQLYVGGSASGAEQTTWSNHVQVVHLSNVTIAANQTVAVYVKARGTNYYGYAPQLTIVQSS